MGLYVCLPCVQVQMSGYNVLVDFEVAAHDGEIEHIFDGCTIHVEGIGPDQYQVGLGIEAPPRNQKEAHRRGVNVVTSLLEASGLGSPNWVDSEVYDE